MRRVMVTGAAGGVAGRLRRLMPGLYPEIVWSDRAPLPDPQPDETFLQLDLADAVAVERGLEGVDGIVHLGGASIEKPWETILEANIVGCYNLFEAARRQAVKRIVFASTNHTVGFYPRHRRIGADALLRPDTRYGASKAFGEALGGLYAHKHGIGVTCLRIGNVDEAPRNHRLLSIWLHPEDLLQLIRIGLEHPEIRHEVFYGASDNQRAWWDNAAARRFGYRPRHRAEDHLAAADAGQAELPPDPVGDWYQGGSFCSLEYDAPGELAPY